MNGAGAPEAPGAAAPAPAPDAALALPPPAPPRQRRRFARVLLLPAAALLVAGSGWLGYRVSERQGIAAARVEASHRLELFGTAVEGIVKRLEYVPATVQLHESIQALLREPQRPPRVAAANATLRRLNAHLGSSAVFVLDQRGVVVASSNSEEPDDSRLGEDVAFRPYFLDALAGRVGRHFAIGVHEGGPGYFVSHPIRDGARVLGVAAVKIGLQPVQEAWTLLGAPALVADVNQVVILSSEPAWRYTALTELPLERRVDLEIAQLYGDQRIAPFPLPVQLRIEEDSQVVEDVVSAGALLRGQPQRTKLLLLGRTLDGMDWRLLSFTDLQGVRSPALLHGMLSALATGFLLLLGLFLAQRRRAIRQRLEAQRLLQLVNAGLEQKVARRTRVLSETNARLRREVAERQQAEQTLRAVQDERVQAAKLAVLGQLATGITHELTQPLGAIRTLSGNAAEFLRRGDLNSVAGNLSLVSRLADQMGGLIQPLKVFARKSQAVPVRCDVAQAVSNALFLYEHRLRKEGVELRNGCAGGCVFAWCDPNRLEQVLINLIGNALDAMAQAPAKVLGIEAALEPAAAGEEGAAGGARRVRLDVFDSGSGFSADALAHVFEPFFTTKPAGAGLGLGLVISRDIARDFDGTLEAANRAEGGARLTLRLPAAPDNPEP